MVFSSVLLLFYFMPITLFLYYVCGRGRNYVLLIFSLLFYFCSGIESFPIIIASIVLNYLFGLLVTKGNRYRKAFIVFAVISNIGLLFYFKYFNFAGEIYGSVQSLISSLPVIEFKKVTLPIGISFFTFQGLAYVIDVYRGKIEPQRNITKVGLYISMFPQLIAGPIVRYNDIRKQMDELSVKKGFPTYIENVCMGAIKFICGLAQKVIIADVLAESVDMIFAMDVTTISTEMAWIGAVFYTLQIYFDFSGYSDMAIGLGKMIGYDFPKNFNLPYISSSIREFWRRWHMTLSTWFRDYLYISLGGNRKGNVYVNLTIVFLCTGLWHGAAWSFIVWVLWHGLFMILERVIVKNVEKEENKESDRLDIYHVCCCHWLGDI